VAEEAEPKKKRRLKQAPQTIRERAEQVQAKADAPKKSGRVKQVFAAIFKPLAPVGRFFTWLGHFRVMRWIGLVLFPPYFRNSWKELKQVTWPSWKESYRLTSAVLIFAIVFGLLVAITDYGLDKVFKKVILKQ
jgi:preprotein translocase SecE subunit